MPTPAPRLPAAPEQAAALPRPLLRFGRLPGRGFLRLASRSLLRLHLFPVFVQARFAEIAVLLRRVVPDRVPAVVGELRSAAPAHGPLRLAGRSFTLLLAAAGLLLLHHVQPVTVGVRSASATHRARARAMTSPAPHQDRP